MINCSACGEVGLNESFAFCTACGKKLSNADYPTVTMEDRTKEIPEAQLNNFLAHLYENQYFYDFQFDARFGRLFDYLAKNHPKELLPAMTRLGKANSAGSHINEALVAHFDRIISDKLSHEEAYQYLVDVGIL